MDATRAAYRSRSPCGERGLKLRLLPLFGGISPSLPVRGAWIEMLNARPFVMYGAVAPRAGSVD